jgi:hypothetical protein
MLESERRRRELDADQGSSLVNLQAVHGGSDWKMRPWNSRQHARDALSAVAT